MVLKNKAEARPIGWHSKLWGRNSWEWGQANCG